jgi:uncharacterized metal-binding protein YceD (DUF177 family)
MQLDLDLDGIVSVECGRCLEEYSLPIDVQKHLLIRMVEKPSREDDDDDSGFFSDGELSSCQEIEVDDEYFFQHLLDDERDDTTFVTP